MIHLRAITRRNTGRGQTERFPYTIGIIQSLDELTFTTPITFLIGENGSGKSTLLEAIAAAAGSITVGSEAVTDDATLSAVHELAKQLKLIWNKRTRRGFFMRSEDFFGYAQKMAQTHAELERDLQQVDRDYEGRSEYARGLARMSYATELSALQKSYGEGLDAQSHGESFFKLFERRFVPDGLYLLDEPEAPLSPARQLQFLAMLALMVERNAQFIIATHSPILMAFPEATIYSCDGESLEAVSYDEIEHVNIMRDFLNHPDIYLRHLMKPE